MWLCTVVTNAVCIALWHTAVDCTECIERLPQRTIINEGDDQNDDCDIIKM